MQDDEMTWIRSTSLAKVLLLVVTLACATAAVADGEIPATLEIVVTAERPGAADHARQKLKPLKVLPGLFTEDHTMRPWGM